MRLIEGMRMSIDRAGDALHSYKLPGYYQTWTHYQCSNPNGPLDSNNISSGGRQQRPSFELFVFSTLTGGEGKCCCPGLKA